MRYIYTISIQHLDGWSGVIHMRNLGKIYNVNDTIASSVKHLRGHLPPVQITLMCTSSNLN